MLELSLDGNAKQRKERAVSLRKTRPGKLIELAERMRD